MEHSEASSRPFIRTTRVEPQELLTRLTAIHAVAPFQILMANYWNGDDTFDYYNQGIARLTARLNDCLDGSAFGEHAEVRWRRVDKKFWLALVADANQQELVNATAGWDCETAEIEMARCRGKPRENSVLLWGTKYLQTSNQWIEARIPRSLAYPVKPEVGSRADYDHVQMHVMEYLDERGRVVAFRRTGLSARVKGSGAATPTEEENDVETDQA